MQNIVKRNKISSIDVQLYSHMSEYVCCTTFYYLFKHVIVSKKKKRKTIQLKRILLGVWGRT